MTIGPNQTSLERPRGKKERREKKGQASPAAGKQASRQAGRQARQAPRDDDPTNDTQYPAMLAEKRQSHAARVPERESSPGTAKRTTKQSNKDSMKRKISTSVPERESSPGTN